MRLRLKPAEVDAMFALSDKADHLKRELESGLKVARMGDKVMRWERGAAVREEDPVERLFVASTHDSLLVFTNRGRVHCVRVWDVPAAAPAAPGPQVVRSSGVPQRAVMSSAQGQSVLLVGVAGAMPAVQAVAWRASGEPSLREG